MTHFFLKTKSLVLSNLLNFIIILLCSQTLAISSEGHDIELARRFLAIEKFENAVEVLERLYTGNPDDVKIQAMLREAYAGAKMYDKLCILLQNMLLREPDNPTLWVELGGIHLSQNKPDEAWNAFDRAVSIAPHNQSLVMQIHWRLQQWSFIDEDIKFLKKSRKRLGNEQLFSLELARLYEIKGKYDKAVGEYSNYLKLHPDRFNDVERRIDISDRTPEELEQLLESFDELFDAQVPRWQPWKLISLVQQRLDNYQQAYESLLNAEYEREETKRGILMAYFVEEMLRIKQYEIARAGAEFMLENTGANFMRTGRFNLALALRGLGQYEKALAHLDTLVRSGKPRISQDAAVLLAEILLENMHQPDSALSVIDNFVETAEQRKTLGEDGLCLKGKILLHKRKFSEAKEFLSQSFTLYQSNERLGYLLAMTYFFSGSFDTAANVMHNVVAKYPKNEMGNETVELLLLMQTAPEQMEMIREPSFMVFIHDTSAAAELWLELADDAIPEIGDYVLWKLGNCQISLVNPEGFETMKALVADYSESFYAPLAIEILADRQMELGDNPSAVELYTEIINKYPDAVNIESVRQKLRNPGNL